LFRILLSVFKSHYKDGTIDTCYKEEGKSAAETNCLHTTSNYSMSLEFNGLAYIIWISYDDKTIFAASCHLFESERETEAFGTD